MLLNAYGGNSAGLKKRPCSEQCYFNFWNGCTTVVSKCYCCAAAQMSQFARVFRSGQDFKLNPD
jgi:hypothetical protein